MQRLDDIHIRDPFILPVPEEDAYYLFGTTDESVWGGPGEGFDCFRSTDLVLWSSAQPAFRPPAGFWATEHFWAPEVHRWQGRYVMLATFAGRGDDGQLRRGTQSLVADHPAGPYVPLSKGTLTPSDWLCLDGTLLIDTSGTPWLVYCREWLDVNDGQILAQRLSEDLASLDGAPRLLFSASEAPWTRPLDSDTGSDYVTDGPSFRRLRDGGLAMMWSSRSSKGYAVGVAYSNSGEVFGPWEHESTPIWDHDGGHAMSFDADGTSYLVLHRPNEAPLERAVLTELLENADPGAPRLRIGAHDPLTV